MTSNLSKSARRIQEVITGFGLKLEVVELSDSTRTAQEAADAIGCSVDQIAKSLVFKGKTSKMPVMVVASGSNRVNEKKFKQHIGEALGKADAAFVLEHTGFAIGGVPPIGHTNPVQIFIDEDLMQYSEVWAAAGTPNAVFKISPKSLVDITRGKTINLK
ncbi:MAG TPA: YbaK/EbsC family protein [Clostridia bacterium]|nr:YbaK/EbsC family protein [Clostridia bacterium]